MQVRSDYNTEVPPEYANRLFPVVEVPKNVILLRELYTVDPELPGMHRFVGRNLDLKRPMTRAHAKLIAVLRAAPGSNKKIIQLVWSPPWGMYQPLHEQEYSPSGIRLLCLEAEQWVSMDIRRMHQTAIELLEDSPLNNSRNSLMFKIAAWITRFQTEWGTDLEELFYVLSEGLYGRVSGNTISRQFDRRKFRQVALNGGVDVTAERSGDSSAK